jgi:predicted DNA-binding antitoxin AbrB/MazE fold protein
MRFIEARYDQGMLKPAEPLALRSGESVHLIVVRRADPKRWDIRRLAEAGSAEEVALAEQGIENWLEKLDEEDQR